MRAVVQRVSSASVTVANRVIGEIAHGLLALIGVEKDDGVADVEYIANKISDLRVFEDAERHMNRSVHDVGGGAGGFAVHARRRLPKGPPAVLRRRGAAADRQAALRTGDPR